MANYDDVIEKNKRYLTKAQVNALVAASKEYNIQNAGNRAGALASAREQYDTGYRGLQNMGLAGGVSAAPTSGEVPRLKADVQTPFDAYNNRLKQVENMRLNALGGQMAQSTRRARAAAAASAAAASDAEERAREEQRISAGLRQTGIEATGKSGSSITSDPKRQRNVNMTDTASNGEREAQAAARARAAAEATRISAGLRQTPTESLGLSSTSINRANRQRNVNMTDTGTNGEASAQSYRDYVADQNARAKAIDVEYQIKTLAAASVLGVATNKYNDAQTRAQMEANAGKATETPKFKVQSGSTAASDLKRSQNVGMTDTASNRNNTGSSGRYATQGTTWASQRESDTQGPSLDKVNDAISVYESAMKAYEDTAGHGAPSESSREPINKANELLNSLGFKSIYDAKRYRDSAVNTKAPERSSEEPEYLVKARREMENAKANLEGVAQQHEIAKQRLNDPNKYKAMAVLSNPSNRGTAEWTSASHMLASDLADDTLESMGIAKPKMSDTGFSHNTKAAKDLRRSLNVIDSLRLQQENKRKTGTTGDVDYEQMFIDEELEELKKLGYTEEEARKLVEDVDNERTVRSEYDYYHDAFEAEFYNDGMKPTKPVDQSETDATYRAANNLPSNTWDIIAQSDNPNVPRPVGPVEYMTDAQRDAYNAIYEKKGIDAANKYVEDITPILNLQRAEQDEAYRREQVNDGFISAVGQNILSVGTNLIGNVPAMLEKLAISGYNIVANPDVPKYIDQYSDLSQLSNRTNYIREATSEKILENHPNTWGKVLNFAYQSGMSMADSAAAMGVAGILGTTHAVDALFFSSAGNEAYRNARARGATQEQAMGFSILSGAAEAIFEHVSVETFADQFLRENAKARRSMIAKLLVQSGVESSEEVTTEIANKLADAWVMGDKSEYNLKVKELMDQGVSKDEADKRVFMDALGEVGMAGLGGLVSGLGFGAGGAVISHAQIRQTGKYVKENGKLNRVTRAAKLLGGDVAQQAAEVEAGKQSDTQVGSLLHEVQTAQNDALGIDAESNEQLTEEQTEEIAKKGEALDVILEGEQIDAGKAQTVIDTLGKDTVAKMGYDASSANAFADSYNNKLAEDNIAPMSEVTNAEREFAQGKAVNELRERSLKRVYKNPTQGLAYQSDGRTITPMPGNMTAVSFAEQERNNFQARTTATTGNVTYAFSGMQARAGMSNEQTLAEMQKALTKEARNKAEVYEKLSTALGIKMTIHDVMTGTNGFIDENGNMHVVLSGKQSVLRVAAHELTHWMKEHNDTGYASMREHLVNDVGQERFDRMLKQKAREYGIDMSTEKGKTIADDEVCAELCERMLANEEALEKFAEKDTEAAKSLKDRLLKILNAIKKALKSVSNRDFGESWSDLISEQETIESWVTALQKAIDNAEKRGSTTTAERQVNEKDELFMDADTQRAAQVKKAVEESAQKKTYVRGYSAAEVESVLSAGVLGDKSNYEGNDYENARGMIAQLIPDIVSALNGEADIDEVNEKVKTAVGVMMDNYFEDEGNMAALREDIPDLIGVDTTAKGDLKAQDQSLFQMSARLSKALGKRVTLVSEKNAKGQKNAKYKIAEKLEDLWTRTQERYGLSDDMDFSLDPQRLLDFIEQQADTRKTARELFGSSLQDEIDSISSDIIDAVADMYGKKTGERFSLDTDALRKENKGMGDIRKEETYSYDNLVNQDPMFVYDMPALGTLKTGNSIDLEKVSDMGLKNAASVGKKVGETEYSIQNRYTKNQIRLSKNAIEHGLNVDDASRLRTNARLAAISGTIVKNAIPINAVTPKNKQASWAYVMCCLLNSGDRQFIAAVHVNQFTNAVENIDFKEVVHSVSGRITKEADRSSTRETGNNPATSASNISIADFLDIVNNTYRSILSQSVLNHYGEERPANGLFSKDAIYSLDTDSLRSQKEYEQKRDELYSSLTSAKDKLRKAEAKRKEVLESKEYNDAVEAVTKAKGDELDAAIKKYVAFMNESGANGAQREIDALKKDVERLSKEFDDLVSGKQQSGRVRAIEKSGLSEQDYDRKQAGKEFGYTPYFYDAGYMLPDGKLLNFSGEKGRHFGTRGQDHRAIGTIYEDSEGSEAMIRFMNGGNIRVMAETPGIDISNVTEPTREQYAKIRSFAQESAGKRFFNVDISDENGNSVGALTYDGRVSPDKVVNDIKHYFETGEIRQQSDVSRFLYSLDTDAAREAFTKIDTEALDKGLESLKNVTPGKGLWAIKDISRFLDSVSGGNKELRDTLTGIFETPHRQALKNYATGVNEMQQRVLDIGAKAGVCDSKGHHFDSKKSAAIQNIGEGFSNRPTDVSVRMMDADAVRVTATDKETGKALGTKDYTFRELRGAYGREVADQLWSEAFDAAQEAGKPVDVEREVNTQPYTLDDLKSAYPQDWQKLKTAADEFRTMYDEYIRDINNMLETIYPNASKYATVDKITEAIEKKQQRLADRKAAYNIQIENLQKSLEKKEQEIASKKNTDTKAFRELVDQANQIKSKIADAQAEIAEYEANVKDELTVMGEEKALMQNAEREGDSLGRMHRLEYRSDYFHHFTEMTSGVQNLKSIFTGNTDISPAVVGKSDQTKPKSRFAGFFQKRQGGDYTADALNGMLRYGQLAEYKLAFDPFAAYLRNVEKQVTNLDKNATNRDNLIRYIQQWTNTILGKSHTIDRALVDSGIGMRSKMFKALSWINSRVIQNTLLWNMRSALIQISNVTNAKGIVTNNLDWANGLRKWALAARGNSEMQSIMNQSTFLASRYMDNLQLTDSVFKNAKQFAGWMLGALDEVSAKATWWAAYTQYQRNPNAKVIQNAYRTYDNAIDYADDVTRRTHAGRGVGELAPAMTSRVINLVAPFQVEVNNTYQLLKDNVKQKNYLGLLSTGLSVFALNTIFEAIVGSTPLGFDIIRAIVDIAFGIAGDDPNDDDDDYDVGRAAQRLAGEFVGGLPYANQIVGLIGKDNAEKVIGSDTDVTRYGNTQIGLNAMMNTIAGISDIGSAVKEGKNLFTETNFISDIDDLLNIIMPMGAKQLTRTAEGLMTVAKGYGSKADKEGNEKVQFVADQDLVNWLHAGLFGKWALTQSSEYFDEERLLPKLFGVYEGPKSATGQMIDAKEYKAALETGIDGKQFFTLKDDMKSYSTQGGKRAELMQQDFKPEQKAKLDALMVPSKDAEMKVEGAVVYQKSGEDWKVKADYSNQDMFDLSQAGDKAYTGTLEAMEKTGLPQDQAALAASMWDQAKQSDDSKAEFRNLLRDNKNLTVAQKEALDLQYCGNKYPADYSDPDLYELSLDGNNRSTYEKAKQAKAQGVPVKTYTSLADKKKEHEGEGQAAYMRQEIMKTNLTAKQKELMDDLLVSDSGRNPDYSSQAWFDVSMLGKTQYETAQEGAKVGLKPEVYLKAYKKYKEIQAKDENGKYINNKRKAKELMKEYLDKLPITAPVYDYIWYNVFKQKKK